MRPFESPDIDTPYPMHVHFYSLLLNPVMAYFRDLWMFDNETVIKSWPHHSCHAHSPGFHNSILSIWVWIKQGSGYLRLCGIIIYVTPIQSKHQWRTLEMPALWKGKGNEAVHRYISSQQKEPSKLGPPVTTTPDFPPLVNHFLRSTLITWCHGPFHPGCGLSMTRVPRML